MNLLQPDGLCRRASLVALSGLFIGFTPLSHAEFADNATKQVEAVYNEGIGLNGNVDLGKCVMRVNPDSQAETKNPAQAIFNHPGSIKDVGISLNKSHLVKVTFDDMQDPTYLVRSEDLIIASDTGNKPGWVIREFRFTKGKAMEARVQLNDSIAWTWDCSDAAVNITNVRFQDDLQHAHPDQPDKKPPAEL
ncbi:hypothetical protein [Endozoicomonas sp. ALC020]|uniref:hypothetical protein n=1 Tax=unclassified Endozoicomonas TaxID=2644528 RepID=UPI003BB049DA